MSLNPGSSILEYIDRLDQVLVAAQITEQETIECCRLAMDLQMSNVWIKPCYLRQTINIFRNASLKIGTFIGYPFGISTTEIKLAETKRILAEGVDFLALSPNIGDIISGNTKPTIKEIECVTGLAHMNGTPCMLMIDISLLDASQVLLAAETATKGSGDGIIFKASTSESYQINQLVELRKVLEGNEFSTSVHFTSIVSPEDIKTISEAGFDRVGMTIIN